VQKYKKSLIITKNLLIFIKMKEKKEYIPISLSIDRDLHERMDKTFINKSRLVNNLIKKQIKKEKK